MNIQGGGWEGGGGGGRMCLEDIINSFWHSWCREKEFKYS